MNINFKNKKVLISGSSKGIGLIIAKKFIECEAKVSINSRNLSNLNKAKKIINHPNLNTLKFDLSISNNAKKLVDSAYKKMRGLDIVVCNLGDGRKIKEVGDESYVDWINTMRINLFSAVSLVNYSKKYLSKSNFPSIICISSICGLKTLEAPVDYSAAKAAMISYVKSQSKILIKKGIRINCISPGNIYTEDGRWKEKIKKNKNLKKKILKEVPINRFGTPEEIAYCVLFLSSEYSSFTNGANFIIDGGQSS